MSDNALDRKIAEATEVFEKDVGACDVEIEIRGLSKEIDPALILPPYDFVRFVPRRTSSGPLRGVVAVSDPHS